MPSKKSQSQKEGERTKTSRSKRTEKNHDNDNQMPEQHDYDRRNRQVRHEDHNHDDYNNNANAVNQSRSKKEKKHNYRHQNKGGSRSKDPSGFSTKTNENFYQDDEKNPLTVNSKQQATGNNNDSEMEECELLDDTFTFIMTAKYPFDYCFQSSSKNKNQKDDKQQEESLYEDDDIMFHQAVQERDVLRDEEAATSNNSLLDKVDSDAWYLPFVTGFFVILMQLFIYTVVIANVFRSELPPNADRWLRLAQIFAVIVTLYTQSDFIDGIFLITERWKAFQEVTTPIKFNVSAVLRIIAGNVGIGATFILVMYSTEVVDLLLNFTAMEFVATLDGSAFELASKGFLGMTLEKKCLEIQEFRYHRQMRRGAWTRLLVYGFYVLLVFASFLTIVSFQAARAVGVDNEVYVQFDDSNVPELFGISGVYKGCKGFRTKGTGMIGYIGIGTKCPRLDENDNVYSARSFVYCFDNDGWVYLAEDTKEPCQDFLLRAFLDDPPVDSNSFDILTHSQANWVIRRPQGETMLETFFLESVESFKTNFVYCGDNEDGVLRRYTGGDNFKDYEKLPNNDKYYPTFTHADGTKELYLDLFPLSYRPIFRKKIPGFPDRYEVVAFDGLRWNRIFLNPTAFAEWRGTDVEDCAEPECWKVFVQYFQTMNSWQASLTVALHKDISNSLLYLSPGDTGVPTGGLQWFEADNNNGRIEPGRPLMDENDNSITFECLQTSSLQCNAGNETQILIDITTDAFPDETKIFVFLGESLADLENVDSVNQFQVSSAEESFDISTDVLTDFSFSQANTNHFLGGCVGQSVGCIQVVVVDTFGDGIFAPGGYEIRFGDEPPVAAFDQDWGCRSYQFGTACADSSPPQPVDCDYFADIIDNYPRNGAVLGGSKSDNAIFFGVEFDPDAVVDDAVFNGEGGTDYPSIGIGVTTDVACSADETLLTITFLTDNLAGENAIAVFAGQSMDDLFAFSSTGDCVESGNFELSETEPALLCFSDAFTEYTYGSCLPASTFCVQVVVLDGGFNGLSDPGSYYIIYGDEVIVEDTESFWSCSRYQFGNGCVNTPENVPADCSLADIIDWEDGIEGSGGDSP